MWALKWGINALVFSPDLLAGVRDQISLRLSSSSGGESFSRVSVLMQNLDVVLAKSSYRLILAAAGGASLLCGVRAARRMGMRVDVRALLLLIPMAVPFVWTLLLANHSFDHTYYTYRNLCCAVFAACTLAALWPGFSAQEPQARSGG